MTSAQKSTKRKQQKPEQKQPVVKYTCSCCGEEYKLQNGKFYRNYSPMFRSNGGYNTVCMSCMSRDYESYLGSYGNVNQALKRMCEKYDYYFDRDIATSVEKISDTNLAFGKYVSKLILAGHKEKTYDSTLDEDFAHEKIMNATDVKLTNEEIKDDLDVDGITIDELATKWGYGYSLEQYSWLEAEYMDWVTRNECKDKSQEYLFILICQSQLDIFEARRNNADPKTIDTLTKSFLSLLDSAKLQPKQAGDTQDNEMATMGMWAKMIENKQPISKPAKEWEDVDGIKRLIKIIVGGIAKMVGVQNEYVQEYQDMLDEYTVEVSEDSEDNEDIEETQEDYFEDDLDEESSD